MLIFLFPLFLPTLFCSPTSSSFCSTATFENGEKFILVDTSTRVKMVTEAEACQIMMNVLLVGGGGDDDVFEGHGGGSGFVDFIQVRLY
jgi:hypothetical protein